MAGKNQVTLTFAGDSTKLEKAFERVGSSAEAMVQDVDKSSKKIDESGRSLDRVSEAADGAENKFQGMASTLDGSTTSAAGLAALAKGDLYNGLLLVGQGGADLAEGVNYTVVPALKAAVTGFKGAATAAKTFTLSLLTNPIFLVGAAIAALAGLLVVAYHKSEAFRTAVDNLGGDLKNILVTGVNAAGDALEKFSSATEAVTAKVPGSSSVVSGLKAAFNPLGNAVGTVSAGLDWFNKKTEDSEQAMVSTGAAAEDYATAQERLNGQVDAANRALQDQLDLLDKWYGQTKSAEEAEIGYEAAIDSANQSLVDNGRTVDVHTAKGRANRQSLLDLADGNKTLIDAMRDNGATQGQLNKTNEASRLKFIALAVGMGMSQTEAQQLATDLYRIPEKTNTNVSVSGAGAAKGSVDSLLGSIRLLPSYKTIQIRYTETGVNLTTPSRVGGRAAGGPVTAGTPYMVGEKGPELWVPSANGSIVPNHKLGGSGGGVTVVVNGALDPTSVAQQVQKLLLNLKRTNGGLGLGLA